MEWERPRLLFGTLALTATGWQRNVLIDVRDSVIDSITPGSAPAADSPVFELLLPGLANVHSHAFQRAMAGLTEAASPKKDDNFWTWREVMYAFAAALTPEQVQDIAQALYIQLLKHGYTAIGEFHYLHNGRAGRPYASATELSDRIIAAAQASGIHLTHLPVLYETSDFGGVPPTARQQRFVQPPDAYLQMLETLVKNYAGTPEVAFGFAPIRCVRRVQTRSVRSWRHFPDWAWQIAPSTFMSRSK